MVNWERYNEIDRQVDELGRANPVTVTVSLDEYIELKRAVLLLRRIMGPDGNADLRFVEAQAGAIAAKINEQFANDPRVQELRAEQMAMLEKDQRASEGR